MDGFVSAHGIGFMVEESTGGGFERGKRGRGEEEEEVADTHSQRVSDFQPRHIWDHTTPHSSQHPTTKRITTWSPTTSTRSSNDTTKMPVAPLPGAAASGGGGQPRLKQGTLDRFFAVKGLPLSERLAQRGLLPVEGPLSIHHKGSLFKAFAVVGPRLRTQTDAESIIKYLRQDRDILLAAHLSYGYSLYTPSTSSKSPTESTTAVKGSRVTGGSDDGEVKAKWTIITALQKDFSTLAAGAKGGSSSINIRSFSRGGGGGDKESEREQTTPRDNSGGDVVTERRCGVLIAVARWFGGHLLGPARFDHITEVTSAALSQGIAHFSQHQDDPMHTTSYTHSSSMNCSANIEKNKSTEHPNEEDPRPSGEGGSDIVFIKMEGSQGRRKSSCSSLTHPPPMLSLGSMSAVGGKGVPALGGKPSGRQGYTCMVENDVEVLVIDD